MTNKAFSYEQRLTAWNIRFVAVAFFSCLKRPLIAVSARRIEYAREIATHKKMYAAHTHAHQLKTGKMVCIYSLAAANEKMIITPQHTRSRSVCECLSITIFIRLVSLHRMIAWYMPNSQVLLLLLLSRLCSCACVRANCFAAVVLLPIL